MIKIIEKRLHNGNAIKVLRHVNTGLALVTDDTGRTGTAHPCVKQGQRTQWGKRDSVILVRGYLYNISRCIITSDLDVIAATYCNCGGNHGQR